MAQYAPLHRGKDFPHLDRTITSKEYDRAVDTAWDMGFENAFVQDMDSRKSGIPDFGQNEPFRWK